MGAFVFNQIQRAIVNPNNMPVAEDGYFCDEAVLENVPTLLTYLGLLYATLLIIGRDIFTSVFLLQLPDRTYHGFKDSKFYAGQKQLNRQILSLLTGEKFGRAQTK